MKTAVKTRLGSRRQPEESRAAILHAAVREFSREGLAGARTDAIARDAKVNKALLYYYFKDKESLHSAVLDQVFGELSDTVLEVLARDLPPQAKMLSYVGAHFDYIASHPLYPRIVQSEMMRAGRGPSQLDRIVPQYFRPLFEKVSQLLKEGAASGDFRPVNPIDFIPSMIAIITFYFTNAPVMRMMTNSDPMDPKRIAARRAAVLDFIANALFNPVAAHGDRP
ncbi:MAG TPA: TetR/AcrR family transcriptional regulator [Terriglobales bacterium]|jgi:TetR/AcrR family transcriptional regulator